MVKQKASDVVKNQHQVTSVAQANSLVEASYALTLNEMRLLLMAISQIRPNEEGKIDGTTPFVIRAKAFAEQFGLSAESAYKEIKAAESKLFDRYVVINNPGVYGSADPDRLKTRWVQSVAYKDRHGEVTLYFSTHIIPYITQLNKGQFTLNNLEDFKNLTSYYSYRLLMIISQWRAVGKVELSIEEIRERLMLGDTYKQTLNLNQKVIKPAIEQINELTGYEVTCTQLKKGRVIYGYLFTIQKKNQDSKQENLSNTKNNKLAKPEEKNTAIMTMEEFLVIPDFIKHAVIKEFVEKENSSLVKNAFKKDPLFVRQENYRVMFEAFLKSKT